MLLCLVFSRGNRVREIAYSKVVESGLQASHHTVEASTQGASGKKLRRCVTRGGRDHDVRMQPNRQYCANRLAMVICFFYES